MVRVRDRTLNMAVVCLVLARHRFSTSWRSRSSRSMIRWTAPGGAVLAVVVEATSELSLFAIAVALVDVATSVATTPVLVEVGA
jgi:hypothetical protein